MTNLRKLSQSTPFVNFELYDEDERYHSLQTDEEMVYFFHEMLSKYEWSPYITMYIYEMMAFGTQSNLNIIPKSI